MTEYKLQIIPIGEKVYDVISSARHRGKSWKILYQGTFMESQVAAAIKTHAKMISAHGGFLK